MLNWFLAAMVLLLPVADAGTDMGVSLPQIRREYYAAVQSATTADRLHSRLQALPSPTPLLKAYLASVEAVQAKHSWNPYNKLALLSSADQTMAVAVQSDPKNIEIRFLRFSYEHYVPAFLGYSKHLQDDRRVIVQELATGNLGQMPRELVPGIVQFLQASGRCSPAELARLKAVAL